MSTQVPPELVSFLTGDSERETMENPGDPYTLDEYQSDSQDTAVYPGQGTFFGLMYVMSKLAGEAGEFAENVGKAIRDDGVITIDHNEPATTGLDGAVAFAHPMKEERRLKLIKELGDVLWYVSANARELGVSLSYIARQNRAKLSDRKARGTLQGAGDDR